MNCLSRFRPVRLALTLGSVFWLSLAGGCRHAAPLAPPTGPHGLPPLPRLPVRCTVTAAGGGPLTLTLAAPGERTFPAFCAQLAPLVHVSAAPQPEDVAQAQQTLTALGYFAEVRCSAAAAAAGITCALTPAPIVRSFHVGGHVPFALFADDLRRRVSLRPGTVLHDVDAELAAQERRLQAYLFQEGYFDAVVAITPHEVGGAFPHRGVHLDIAVSARRSSSVRRVEVVGRPGLPVQTLAGPFFHRGPLFYVGRFRPAQLQDDVDEAIARLRHRGHVGARVAASYHVDAAAHAVDISLRVNPGPRVRLRLEGERALSLRQLHKLAPFASDGAVDAIAVETLRSNVRAALQQRGYVDAQVQANVSRGIEGRTRVVTLQVACHARRSIGQISVVGARRLPAPTLLARSKLLVRTSSRWRRQVWRDADVAHDVDALRTTLARAGFAEADVRSERSVRADGTLNVRFVVREGPRTQVAGRSIVGVDDAALAQRLLGLLQQRPGAPFYAPTAEHDAQEVHLALTRAGYIDADVQAEVEEREATADDARQLGQRPGAYAGRSGGTPGGALLPGDKLVTLQYVVQGRRQARLVGLMYRGNFRTRRSTLRQEMALRCGRPLDLPQLGAAKRAVRATNLFDGVELSPHAAGPNEPNTVLVLAVEERGVRSLDGVAGYASDFRFSVGADWHDANVLGRAMLLRLSARLGNARAWVPHLRIGDQDLVEAQLRAPHPFGLPVHVDASAQYRYQDVTEYRERRVGGQAAVSRTFAPRRCALCPTLSLRLGYEINEAYREYDPALRRADASDATIARLVPSLNADARDSATDPKRGYNLDVRLEGAHPAMAGVLGARASAFWRLLVAGQIFVPLGTPVQLPLSPRHALGGPWVLALAVNYGAAGPFGRRGAVPPSESYGYGGDLSVRGLRNRASSRLYDNPDYVLTASCELRVYLLENFGFGSVQLAGFVDAGDVHQALADLGRNPTVSAGPALRYVTPVGPLSLAYGRALRLPPGLQRAPDAAPPRGRVHFTFGYTF